MGIFDFLTKPIESFLTPPGTAMKNRDTVAKAYPQKIAGGLLGQLEPVLSQGIGMLNEALPYQKQGLRNLFQMTTPMGIQARGNDVRNQLLGKAQDQNRMLQTRFAGTGGIGMEQGAQIQSTNVANMEANDYLTHLQSPAGQAELSQILNDITKSFPGMDAFAVLNAIIQGRPAPTTGPGALEIAASMAPMFGGGGGGSAMAGLPPQSSPSPGVFW